MTSPTALHLAELMAARFSHDISGPVGAIRNGMEFLEEEGFDMKSQAFSLVDASAREAVARLQFYRLAYGVLNSKGEANLEQLHKIAEEYLSFRKSKLSWALRAPEAYGVVLSAGAGRLLFNLLVIVSAGLLHGGTVAVTAEKQNANRQSVTVKGTGTHVKCDPEIGHLLVDKGRDIALSPRNVQLYFTALQADALGAEMTLAHEEGMLALRVEWE